MLWDRYIDDVRNAVPTQKLGRRWRPILATFTRASVLLIWRKLLSHKIRF